MTRLEFLRRSRGFTQTQLANATGVARTRLSLMERGRAIPPRDGVELSKLAAFFKVSVAHSGTLLDEVGDDGD